VDELNDDDDDDDITLHAKSLRRTALVHLALGLQT